MKDVTTFSRVVDVFAADVMYHDNWLKKYLRSFERTKTLEIEFKAYHSSDYRDEFQNFLKASSQLAKIIYPAEIN